ncbi:MAG: fasciclin domain-containing protein [Rhodothermales bacterium]
MKRIAYPLLLLAIALPLVLTGCARSGEMMNDGDMTMADGAVIPVPVEAGTEEAMELLGATTSPSNTIVENALAIPNLSNLVEAVQAAGLAETLNGPGSFTVFAPINAAFDRADMDEFSMTMSEDEKANLQMLLKSHVADDATMYGSLNEGMMVVMLSGEEFPIGRDENDLTAKRIGNADFIVYDVESSNGVIHLINLVLNPDGF